MKTNRIINKMVNGLLCATFFLMASVFFAEACTKSPPNNGQINYKDEGVPSAGSEELTNKNSSDFIGRAKRITELHSLTSNPLGCLIFELLEGVHDGKVIVDVRELHNEKCGGDSNTSPRLFSIGFDKTDDSIWTDAKSLTGEMERLKDR